MFLKSLLDDAGVLYLKPYVADIKKALSTGQFKHATDLFSKIQDLIGSVSSFIRSCVKTLFNKNIS